MGDCSILAMSVEYGEDRHGFLPFKEIAEVTGIPENTVKTRLFHARKKLMNCLKLMLQREGGGTLAGASS